MSWRNEEKNALILFKERLKDLELTCNPILEDRRLLNWLKARDLNVDAAEKMLRKHLIWRIDNNIDNILTSNTIPSHLLDIIPFDIVGSDKNGNVVVTMYFALVDFKLVLETYGKKMALQICYYILETAVAQIVKNSVDSNILKQVDLIAENDGIRMKDALSPLVLDVLLTSLKSVEANYPELLHKAYLINVPSIYPILWNIMKPLLAQKTADKVCILSRGVSKIRSCLLDHIPENQFPAKWGGTGFSNKLLQLNLSTHEVIETDIKIFKEVVIPAGKSFRFDFSVEKPSNISWRFKTKQYDIGFSLVCIPPISEKHEKNLFCTNEIIPHKRINANKFVQCGSLFCNKPGQYSFQFDNTYSKLREKTVFYVITVGKGNKVSN